MCKLRKKKATGTCRLRVQSSGVSHSRGMVPLRRLCVPVLVVSLVGQQLGLGLQRLQILPLLALALLLRPFPSLNAPFSRRVVCFANQNWVALAVAYASWRRTVTLGVLLWLCVPFFFGFLQFSRNRHLPHHPLAVRWANILLVTVRPLPWVGLYLARCADRVLRLLDGRKDPLSRSERLVYSQFGEDGVTLALFAALGHGSRYYVEFGVEDGMECNTRVLRERHGWKGLLMDGGEPNKAINLHSEFVTAENIEVRHSTLLCTLVLGGSGGGAGWMDGPLGLQLRAPAGPLHQARSAAGGRLPVHRH